MLCWFPLQSVIFAVNWILDSAYREAEDKIEIRSDDMRVDELGDYHPFYKPLICNDCGSQYCWTSENGHPVYCCPNECHYNKYKFRHKRGNLREEKESQTNQTKDQAHNHDTPTLSKD